VCHAVGLLAWRRPPPDQLCGREVWRARSPGLSATTSLSAAHFAVGAKRGREVWRGHRHQWKAGPFATAGQAWLSRTGPPTLVWNASGHGARRPRISRLCCPQPGGSRSWHHGHFVLCDIFTCTFTTHQLGVNYREPAASGACLQYLQAKTAAAQDQCWGPGATNVRQRWSLALRQDRHPGPGRDKSTGSTPPSRTQACERLLRRRTPVCDVRTRLCPGQSLNISDSVIG
jgi:hypothetical protein